MDINYHYFVVEAESPEKACAFVSKHPRIIFWGEEETRFRVLGCVDEDNELNCETESDKDLIGEFSIDELNLTIDLSLVDQKNKQIVKLAIQDLMDHNFDETYLMELLKSPVTIGKNLEWIQGVETVFEFFSDLYQNAFTLSQLKPGEKFNLFLHSYHGWNLSKAGVTHIHPGKGNGKKYCVITEFEFSGKNKKVAFFPMPMFS